jgi:DNA polymerase delta subunit 2
MKGQSSMDSMRQFLEYSYLFPTCPDTIDGYPLPYEDPFIIDEIPHVLFAGNQDSHESKMCEFKNGARTLLMTIPKFCDTREAVILNLKTMETQVFRFDHIIEE